MRKYIVGLIHPFTFVIYRRDGNRLIAVVAGERDYIKDLAEKLNEKHA